MSNQAIHNWEQMEWGNYHALQADSQEPMGDMTIMCSALRYNPLYHTVVIFVEMVLTGIPCERWCHAKIDCKYVSHWTAELYQFGNICTSTSITWHTSCHTSALYQLMFSDHVTVSQDLLDVQYYNSTKKYFLWGCVVSVNIKLLSLMRTLIWYRGNLLDIKYQRSPMANQNERHMSSMSIRIKYSYVCMYIYKKKTYLSIV